MDLFDTRVIQELTKFSSKCDSDLISLKVGKSLSTSLIFFPQAKKKGATEAWEVPIENSHGNQRWLAFPFKSSLQAAAVSSEALDRCTAF